MGGPLVDVDTSNVNEGALDSVKAAIEELVTFIEANAPKLLAYGVYLSEDGRRMTVAHVHTGSDSLEYHLDVGRPAFRRFTADRAHLDRRLRRAQCTGDRAVAGEGADARHGRGRHPRLGWRLHPILRAVSPSRRRSGRAES